MERRSEAVGSSGHSVSAVYRLVVSSLAFHSFRPQAWARGVSERRETTRRAAEWTTLAPPRLPPPTSLSSRSLPSVIGSSLRFFALTSLPLPAHSLRSFTFSSCRFPTPEGTEGGVEQEEPTWEVKDGWERQGNEEHRDERPFPPPSTALLVPFSSRLPSVVSSRTERSRTRRERNEKET